MENENNNENTNIETNVTPQVETNNTENTNTQSFEDQAKNVINDVEDKTGECTAEEINSGKGMSILAYFGILSLIPFLAEKNNKFVVFHAKQGLNLFIIGIIVSVASGVISAIPLVGFVMALIIPLLGLAITALSIMGIIYAAQGQAKELPVVNKIKIIK